MSWPTLNIHLFVKQFIWVCHWNCFQSQFTIDWHGWKDDYSGLGRYAWEVFKLQPRYDGKLQEPPQSHNGPLPVPLKIEAMNHSDTGMVYPSYRPSEPGVYSVILEVGDKANNTVYARRFVLYDPDSRVSTNSSFPMYADSAVPATGHKWQTVYGDGANGATTIRVRWDNHFQNLLHDRNKFLEEILPFQHDLSDMSIDRFNYKQIPDEYDDFEGKRQRNKIENFHGIVKFEIATSNANDQNPGTWRDIPLAEEYTVSQLGVSNGALVKAWVRGTDILGNSIIDSMLVFFDRTNPTFNGDPSVKMNIGDDPMDFRSM